MKEENRLEMNQMKKGIPLQPVITSFLLAHDLHWAEAPPPGPTNRSSSNLRPIERPNE